MNRMMKFYFALALACCCLGHVNEASGQEGPATIYEVKDHSRGFEVTTTSPDWSVQVSRFTFTMIDNPTFGTLKINKAFSQKKSLEETIQAYLKTARENKNAELLSEEVVMNVGGQEARGYSFVVLKDRKTFVHVWFQKEDQLYRVEIQAKEKDYDGFLQSCRQVMDDLQFLNSSPSETSSK